MKILVFSDSHRIDRFMHRAVEMHPDAAGFLHLGDGVFEFERMCERYPDRFHLAVRGNCDGSMSGDTPLEMVTELGNKRVFLTHGHQYGVKAGRETLIAAAFAKRADMVLYGHTHVTEERYVSDERGSLYVFCPGSISCPRDGMPAYGVLHLHKEGILFSVGRC